MIYLIAICEAIKAINWTITPMSKIQCEAIPHGLEGRDIIGIAETDSFAKQVHL